MFDDQLLMLNVSFPEQPFTAKDLDDVIVSAVEKAIKSSEHDIKLAVISHITSTPAVIYP